jgi:hypothetical protein
MNRNQPRYKFLVWFVVSLFSFLLLLPVGKCGPGCPDCKKDCQQPSAQKAQEELPPCHRAAAVQSENCQTKLPQPCCLKSGQKPATLPELSFNSSPDKLAASFDLPRQNRASDLNPYALTSAFELIHHKLKAPPPLYILNSALLI